MHHWQGDVLKYIFDYEQPKVRQKHVSAYLSLMRDNKDVHNQRYFFNSIYCFIFLKLSLLDKMFNLLALHSFHINFQLHVFCYKMNLFHCNHQASKSWWSYTSLNLPFTHSSTQLSIYSSAQNILCFCGNNSVSARNIFVFTLALSDLLLAASIPLTLGDALSQVGFQNLNLKSFSGTLII